MKFWDVEIARLLPNGKQHCIVITDLGGGLELRCQVRLPISSILAATVIQALAMMSERELGNHALSEAVMQLEQLMTTGGGWQNQAGGIFPGAKLLITGPSLRQRIRAQPLAWERRAGGRVLPASSALQHWNSEDGQGLAPSGRRALSGP